MSEEQLARAYCRSQQLWDTWLAGGPDALEALEKWANLAGWIKFLEKEIDVRSNTNDKRQERSQLAE